MDEETPPRGAGFGLALSTSLAVSLDSILI